MTIAIVSTWPNNRMTEAEYERERQRLRDTYGESKRDAGVRWEQELARLFYRSGWTQEELAKKEGKPRRYIAYQLQFGRFLNFGTTVPNLEKPTLWLTERRFRGFWEQTTGNGDNERQRFLEVIRLIEEAEVMLRKPARPKIGKDILKVFADGKWHRPEVIAKKLDTDSDHVIATVENLNHRRIAKVEKRKVGRDGDYAPGHQYRIFRNAREVSLDELTTKLTPLIEILRAQSRKAPGTVSGFEVGTAAEKIQNLLDEWAE